MKEHKIGDIIPFGAYQWRVLDKKENAVLLITECIIDQRPYHSVYKDTTWADCTLRHYLNHEFYARITSYNVCYTKLLREKVA